MTTSFTGGRGRDRGTRTATIGTRNGRKKRNPLSFKRRKMEKEGRQTEGFKIARRDGVG